VEEVNRQLEEIPRKELAQKALENSRAILVSDLNEAMELVNEYAAEHLIICCRDAEQWAEKVVNAGSVFIGNYSPESAGDYASGTNHTLPTNAFARAYSGEGLHLISETVIEMAEAEGLAAHAHAVRIRT
jgi:histidinol dehydrogenase